MSIFGKNNGDEQPIDDFEGGDEFEKEGGLSAASRGVDAPKTKKSGMLLGVLGVVMLGLGGGYFYLNSQAEAPVMPPPDVPADMASAPEMNGVPEAGALPPENVTAAVTAPEGQMPAMPPMPGEEGAPVPADPAALADPNAVPADEAAAATPDAAADALADAPADVTVTTTTTTVTEAAPADAAPGATQSVADVLGEPPADDADPAVETAEAPAPGDAAMPEAPADAAVTTTTTTVTEGAAADAATQTTTAVTTVTEPPPAMPESADDLPLPAGATATTTAATTETAPAADAATAAAGAAPTEGEMAIVQNSGMIDAVTQPANAQSAAEMAAAVNAKAVQEAMIRPLPKQYLIVRKNTDAGNVDARLTAARLALQQGRMTAALELFDELYRDYPKDKRILMGRALALQKLGQNAEALAAYESVLVNEPQNIDALTNMLGLLKKQNPQLAIEKLSQLRDAYPFNADITAQLGIAHADAGDLAQGLKYLDMADALKPGSAYVTFNKAVLFDKMGRSAEAADLYRHIVRLAADGKLDQPLPIETIKARLAVLR